MSDRPAWSKDSVAVRLAGVESLGDITPTWAWGGSIGAGVRVAIVDSGIDADHEALGGSVDVASSVAFDMADGDVIEQRGPHTDAYGHGTACASVIHFLAPEASITSVRVLGANNTGKAAQFIAGLRWAVDEGYDVINLSLGTRKKDWALAFYEVCDEAYFKGSLLVTAANNIARVSYPSLYASVTSVACNTTTDPFRYHFNPEPPTEYLARGIDVDLAWLNGGYTTATGNSFAAPHIAGIAALVKAKHPELRPFQLKTVLWACAANVQEAGPADIPGRLSRAMTRVGAAQGTRATSAVRRP